MRQKPHIVINRHKEVPYKYRCFWGRYNGYADTVQNAYEACIRCLKYSKYLVSDARRNPQLLNFLI